MARLATGVQGFDSMVQGGLPEGSSVVLQGPPGQEKIRFALTFLAEGLKAGASGLVMTASQSPDAILAELRSLGVDLEKATKEGRLRVVDWYSWSEETVRGVEDQGLVLRSSIDLADLGNALGQGVASLAGHLPRRAVIELLSPAMNAYELAQVYSFAQGAKKKLDRFRFTSLVLLEKDMHSGPESTTLHQPFDGVIEIERTRSGDRIIRKIGVLHLKDTAPDPTFRTLEMTSAGMRVVWETPKASTPPVSPASAKVAALESQEARARRLTLIMQIARERLKLDPKDADALFAMAAAQATLDDPRGGVQSLDRLAELNPTYPGLWVLKTKLHARLGEADRARQSRLRAQQVDRPEAARAEPTVPCPMCEAPVAMDATMCENCGVKFAPATRLEDELEDLGRAAIQEIVQEELRESETPPAPLRPPERTPKPRIPREIPRSTPGESPPAKPVPRPTPKKGMTNGLVLGRGAGRRPGMTNGLKGRTNGLRGRTNGLTNGLGRTNGLTNGLGRTNGLTNGLGRTNGLTNGLGRTNGITNGLGRTNGMTNGLAGGRPTGFRSTGFRGMMRTAGWKLYVIPLVVVGLLLMPLFFVPEYRGPAYPIQIDGRFDDWASISTLAMGTGTVSNPNADIVRFGVVDNLGPHAFYVEVAGTVLAGGGASPGLMDTVRIFVDIDASASSGYRIDGVGADRLIEISGATGEARFSTLWEFDANRDQNDWHGWIKGTATPAASSGSRLEVEAEWFAQGTVAATATVHTTSWDRRTDRGDLPARLGTGALSVVAESLVPAIVGGNGVSLLQLTMTAQGQAVSVDSVQAEIVGTAAPGSALALRLMEGATLLSQVTPTSRDARFTFTPLAIGIGTSRTLTVVGDFSASTGETFGVRLPRDHPFGFASGAVGVRENLNARTVGYLGFVPATPRVDGAFAEWTATSLDPWGDVGPPASPNIDIGAYGARHAGPATHLYADVLGRILRGTSAPELPREVPPPSVPAPPDTDRDTVPDAMDPRPLDFNNDGVSDAASAGDYDGDAQIDYGFFGGTDNWLNTTIPGSFPAPYAGRYVSVYIGPVDRPPVLGEDVFRIFADIDNGSWSGYAVDGIGADRLVEVRGKDGRVTQTALLAFSGSFPGEWAWTPLAPVTVALGFRAIELSIPVNATDVVLEAGDFWGSADSTTAVPALAPLLTSFKAASASAPLSVPWVQVGPEPMATLIDGSSNSATTVYNHQRKVVRAGDVTGDTACDATNSDGCWYAVFYDQLVEDASTTSPRGPIVQSGAATLASGSASVDVTITSVNTAKTFLVFSMRFDDTEPGESLVSGRILSSTTLRFERAVSTGAPAMTIEWYVAEFPSGVSVQRGTTTMATATVNVAISSVDTSRSFPIVSYRKSTMLYTADDFIRAKITTSTNLQLTLVDAGAGDGVSEWQVIEYTYSSVQTGDISFATTDATKTATVATVNTAKSWLLFTNDNSDTTSVDIGQEMVRGVVTNANTLTFDRANTGQTMTLTWYLVEFTDDTRVQSGSAGFSTTDTQVNVAITSVDTARAIATAGAIAYRGGKTPYSANDNPGTATVTLDLTTAVNLQLTRSVTGSQTADVGWFVVEFGTVAIGTRVAGTFPTDIQTENAAYIQYRESTPSFSAKVGAFNIGLGGVGTTVPITGVGFQPKVVMFWWSARTESTDTTAGANISRGFGVAVSPTDRRAVYSQSQDAAATMVADTGHHNTEAIGALTTAGTVDGLADLQSMDSGGFTLVIDDQFTINLRVHYLALGGTALTNTVTGMLTEPATTGGQEITTLAFQPDAVLFFSAMIGADPPGTAVDSTMMVGAAAGSTPANAVWAGGSNDGAGTSSTISYSRAGESIALFSSGLASSTGRAGVTQWLSNGFRLDWAEVGGSRRIHYVALKGGAYLVGDLLTQTDTTTTIVESGFGFSPKAGLLMSHALSASSADTVQAHDEWSAGAFTSPTERGAQGTWDEDNLATSETATSVEHDEVYVRISTTDTVDALMDIQSVDSSGFTAIMDDADTSQRFVWYLAFGGAATVNVRYDWTGVPSGSAWTLKVKGYRLDENVLVQALTPPSTWNTRITISATSNTLYTSTLTSAEFNSGSPSIRFVDANTMEDTLSDFWIDLAVIISEDHWDRIVLMRSADTSGSTWGSQIILASGRTGDAALLLARDSSEPSIAIDSSGFLHVVWVSAAATGDQSTMNLVRYTKTSVAHPTQSELATAGNWAAILNVDDVNPGFMPTVSTDTSDNPHVAWSGSKTSGTIYYKNKAAGTWRATVSWGTTYTGLSVDVSPQNNFVSLARYFEKVDAEIGYRSNTGTNTINSPKSRTWDGSTWSAETEQATAGSPIRAVRMAWSPTSPDTRIIVTQSDDGWLDAYVCTPSCTVTNNIGQVWTTAPTTPEKRFDIAYEDTSGEGMLVYGVLSTDTTRDIAYRTFVGGSWSAEQYLDDTGHATDVQYSLINLASKRWSNQIALIGGDDTNNDVSAWIWDGTVWGSNTEIDASAQSPNREEAAIAWESSSGHLLAVAVDSGSPEVVTWKEFTSVWSAASTQQCTTSGDVLQWISLKPNVLSTANDVVMSTGNDVSDLFTCYWTGSAWNTQVSHDTGIDASSTRVFDFAWESTGSKGILVYGTTGGQITYRTFTAPTTWGTATNVPMGANTHPWVQLSTNPSETDSMRVLGAVMEGTVNDLGAIRWDGSTLTVIGASAFTADVGTTTYDSFDLEYTKVGNMIQYVACKDLATSNCDAAAEFTKFDGTAGYDTIATRVESASYPSLATTWDANADLWVAYSEDVNSTTRAIYARFLDYPSLGWQAATTADSLSGTIFTKPSIGIDKNNDVHALYVATSGLQVYYNVRSGGSWGTRTSVDTSSDHATLMVRSPNDPTYGTASGGLYWKSTTSETYFYYIPEFEAVLMPVFGILALLLVRRRNFRSTARTPRA